jgi:hypothetical protein
MENLEILWLDDQRDPVKYFKKKPDEKNATVTRNFAYYKNLFSKYNVSFVWVKSYDAFVDHITNNGVPKFISFDYNLKKGMPTGIDCVNWLLNYCKENGVSMPKSYVHSANPRFGPEMNRMLGLSENKNMDKKNTIRLTESDLKRVISKSVKKVLKEGFNSPLPSFAAKEVEPKHRLRKQWNDDYDAMVARNHARGEEFMDDFNKKANLSYGKSLKENQENLPWSNSDIQNDLIEIKRIVSYLVNDYLDNVSQEQLDELGDMTKKYRQFLSIFMKQIDSKRW